jgi:hypothetical protein
MPHLMPSKPKTRFHSEKERKSNWNDAHAWIFCIRDLPTAQPGLALEKHLTPFVRLPETEISQDSLIVESIVSLMLPNEQVKMHERETSCTDANTISPTFPSLPKSSAGLVGW